MAHIFVRSLTDTRIYRGRKCAACGHQRQFVQPMQRDREYRLVCKCLQCGLIESYFWMERGTKTLVYLPPEPDPPPDDDA